MPDVNRREVLIGSVATGSFLAGWLTAADDTDAPLMGGGGGPINERLALGDWPVHIVDDFAHIDIQRHPTIGINIKTGDTAIWTDSPTATARVKDLGLAVAPTAADLDRDTDQTLAFLTDPGDVALWGADQVTLMDAPATVAIATSADALTIHRYPVLAFLTDTGEIAVWTQ